MSDQLEKMQQLGAQLGLPAPKPKIKLPEGDVQVTDTATELYKIAGAQRGLFFSGGRVMRMFRADTASLPRLEELIPAAAVSEFEKYAHFVNASGKGKPLTKSLAEVLLASDVAQDHLPNVRLLLNRPLLKLNNGRIEQLKAGYNPESMIMVSSGELVESATVEEAVDLLKQVLVDFDFQTEADISRAIACFLTPAMSIGGFIQEAVPIHIIEANESQTGKGYFLQLRDLLYGEKATLITRQKGGVGSMDESFATALLSGRPFVQFDNLRGKMDSEYLEAFVTNAGEISVRVAHSRTQFIDGRHRFISITSNGLEITEDLANRSSFVRLIKEGGRTFTEVEGKKMHELVDAHQGRFAGAIARIIRHYYELGMPRTNESRHDRREWAQKMDWIVQNLFNLPPLMDGLEEAKKRSVNPSLGFARELSIVVEKRGKLGDELNATDLGNILMTAGVQIPGLDKKGDDRYEDATVAQRIGQLLSAAFGDLDELELEGRYRVTRKQQLKHNTSSGNTYTAKLYVFSRIEGSGNQESAVKPEAAWRQKSKPSKPSKG